AGGGHRRAAQVGRCHTVRRAQSPVCTEPKSQAGGSDTPTTGRGLDKATWPEWDQEGCPSGQGRGTDYYPIRARAPESRPMRTRGGRVPNPRKFSSAAPPLVRTRLASGRKAAVRTLQRTRKQSEMARVLQMQRPWKISVHGLLTDLVMLPIVAGSCPQVKTSGSSSQWDILENVLCSEEKISVFGENWAFHNMHDQHVTQERRLRSHLVESLCEGKEDHQCGETLNQITNLTVHKGYRTAVQPYKCTKCGKTFRDCSFQRNQQRSHPGHKPYPCEGCGQACSSVSCLNPPGETDIVEKRDKHQDAGRAAKRYMKSDSSKQSLEHKKSGKALTCPSSFQSLWTEIHVCEVCGKSFSYSQIARHVRTHTGEKPYECKECGKAFTCSTQFQEHVRMHTGEKPYEHKQCGKPSHIANPCKDTWECTLERSLLAYIRRHIKRHSGIKPYECTECGKAFISPSSLREHMRTHSGEKPYQCQHCGKVFRLQRSLQGHMITHSDEKPHQCQQCGKAFKYPISLKGHMKTHSEKKLCECQQHEKAYCYLVSLQKHMKTHTVGKLESKNSGKAIILS
ncbi:hypothetical protein EI555_003718, partial [Monodon monoceros]